MVVALNEKPTQKPQNMPKSTGWRVFVGFSFLGKMTIFVDSLEIKEATVQIQDGATPKRWLRKGQW